MNYDRPELLDQLAAEYVFGTLTSRARRRFERLLRTHPSAQAAVHEWEQRLMPLSEPTAPVTPSPVVWRAIDRRTGGASRERSWMSWWQPAAALAFGIVATVGLVRMYPASLVPVDDVVQERSTLPASYVGLLTDAEGVPTVLASSTRHGRLMSVKILKPIEVPPGKVLQMWALPREGAPFPLGVIPARDKGTFTMSESSEKLLSNVPRLAVSIEDASARPGATPGPFILTGHCVKLW